MLRFTPSRSVPFALALVATTLVACEKVTDPVIRPEPAQLAIHANISSTTIATMVVRVSSPDINPDLVFNLAINGSGVASGTVVIPAGSNRTIVLEAFDINHIMTHRGEKTNVTVNPGTNAPMNIVLAPLTGNQEVVAQLGSFILTVAPAAPLTLAVNGTAQLTLTIFDNATPTPNEITPLPNTVSWATTHPAFFTVEFDPTTPRTATVRGRKAGSGDVVVTYNGFAAMVRITVQ
jgi:hypothetical protein